MQGSIPVLRRSFAVSPFATTLPPWVGPARVTTFSWNHIGAIGHVEATPGRTWGTNHLGSTKAFGQFAPFAYTTICDFFLVCFSRLIGQTETFTRYECRICHLGTGIERARHAALREHSIPAGRVQTFQIMRPLVAWERP